MVPIPAPHTSEVEPPSQTSGPHPSQLGHSHSEDWSGYRDEAMETVTKMTFIQFNFTVKSNTCTCISKIVCHTYNWSLGFLEPSAMLLKKTSH